VHGASIGGGGGATVGPAMAAADPAKQARGAVVEDWVLAKQQQFLAGAVRPAPAAAAKHRGATGRAARKKAQKGQRGLADYFSAKR
jgi:hypothetical protein